MKIKEKKKLIAIITTVAMFFSIAETVPASAAVTSAQTPAKVDYGSLKWARNFGSGWGNSPTPPLIEGGSVYAAAAGKIYKINKENGTIEDQAYLGQGVGVDYATIAPTLGEAKTGEEGNQITKKIIMVPASRARLVAFDAETLDLLWTADPEAANDPENHRFDVDPQYDDNGQTISPVTYKNGYAYYATWNGSGRPGYYYCVDTDNGEIKGYIKNQEGGFYWAGAYADPGIDSGADPGTDPGYVAFGSQADSNGDATLYCMPSDLGGIGNDNESKPIDAELLEDSGNISGNVFYWEDNSEGIEYIFVMTDKSKLYKYEVEKDDTRKVTGISQTDPEEIYYLDLGGTISSGATIHDGKIYAGVSGDSSGFGTSGHTLKIIDCESMTIDDSAPVPGFAKAEKLISIQNQNESGELYLYTTLNNMTGGIYLLKITDNSGTKEIEENNSGNLFVPDTQKQQYCISPLTADSEGNIYYKNDSGNIMVVSEGYTITSSATSGGSITKTSGVIEGGNKDFEIAPAPGYISADIKVDGISQGPASRYTFTNVTAKHSIKAVFIPAVTYGPAKIINISCSSVKLYWNPSANVTGYEILRAKAGGSFAKIADLKSTSTSYKNSGLSKGKKYSYKIRAYYSLSDGRKIYAGTSSVKSITVKPAAPVIKTKTGKRKIKVSWKKVSGAKGYVVYRATKKAGKYKKIKTIKKSSARSWTNKGLKKGKKYFYKVRAYTKVKKKTVRSNYSNISYKKAK
ncbi:MAG TPA: hypothetical protein PLC13_01070 [Bacillota bacterium]|nr:hypothetical protein [Bacillota bacterium]